VHVGNAENVLRLIVGKSNEVRLIVDQGVESFLGKNERAAIHHRSTMKCGYSDRCDGSSSNVSGISIYAKCESISEFLAENSPRDFFSLQKKRSRVFHTNLSF
jgi:hypothetical protein